MVNFDDLSISQAKRAAAIHNLTRRAISGFFLTGAIVLAGVGSVGLYTNIERGKQVLLLVLFPFPLPPAPCSPAVFKMISQNRIAPLHPLVGIKSCRACRLRL